LEILKKDVHAVLHQARTPKSKIALVVTLIVIAAIAVGSVYFWAGVLVYAVTVFHRHRVHEAAKANSTPAEQAKQD
jgi:Ca2+/Na+ antiporter